MLNKPATSLVFPAFLAFFLFSASQRGQEMILLDDSTPTPTPVPAAVKPVVKTAPAPTATFTPTPVPAKVLAVTATPTQQTTEVSTEGPVESNGPTESQAFAQKLGILPHPVLWLVLDGTFEDALWTADSSIKPGFGLSGRVELQFFSWLSAGTYYDLILYPASQRLVFTGPWGIMARIFPFDPPGKKNFSPFVMGGAGINSLVGQNTPVYPGNYHAFVGLGASYSFGDNYSLDLGITYNFFSSQYTLYNTPMQAVGGRAGLAYSFEP